MSKVILIILIIAFNALTLMGQDGHKIKVSLDGYEGKELYLAYHYGDKQYIEDTVFRTANGTFTFTRKDEKLDPGMYMIVIPPQNNSMELLIVEDEQHFSVSASVVDLVGTAKFEGKADDNRLLYQYLNFLNTQRTKAESLMTRKNESSDQSKIIEIASEEKALDDLVRDYQSNLIKSNPESLTAAIIKANIPLDYSGFEDAQDELRWLYTKRLWFDNIDLSDDRLLRTPILEQKVEYFIDKLHVQNPEDIISAIDKVLGVMDQKGENFKFFTIHFLNKYAKSKTVGMDAVYVHIVQTYYAKGLAPWTESSQLTKIIDNASRLAPLLIGKIAPDLPLQTRDGFKVNLHNLESEFTVLYFWRPDCEHCEKTAPVLQEFFEAYRDKGVKIAAICTKVQAETEKCWAYVDENNYNEWIHLADSDQKSNMTEIYDIRATPIIYVLDSDKKIISKRIGADQLKEVIDFALRK